MTPLDAAAGASPAVDARAGPDGDGGVGPGSRLTYRGALRLLDERGRYGVRLGLGRVRALLRALHDPQEGVRGALVAGTNGKGSVIALAGSALRAAGYRVGETPKPHLVTYRERVVVDGRPIGAEAFAALVERVLSVADGVARRLGPPTEFELLTAVMFLHFAEAGLDVALVEVGLGGRLDATNAWDGGVAVVTNVDLDHTDRLGTTIPAIAREKAAIVKRGDRAVTGATAEALAVVRRRCARLGVPLDVAPPARVLASGRDGLLVDLASLGETRVGLLGRHQAANVAVADALLDALESAGIATTAAGARRTGYATATWPGRLELLRVPRASAAPRDADPEVEVLLDGAHNPAGAAALARALDDLVPRGPVTIVWATMSDKDVAGVVDALASARAMADDPIVICTSLPFARALPAASLADSWRARLAGARVVVEPDADAALDLALREARGPVVVGGSLYLVGAVRARLVDDPDLRDPAEP